MKNVEGLDGTPATIEVYSGLYVNEASDISSKSDFSDDVFRERVHKILIDFRCIKSTDKFKSRILFILE